MQPTELLVMFVLFVYVALMYLALLTDWRPIRVWLSRRWCALTGHRGADFVIDTRRIYTKCACGYVSQGWTVGERQNVIPLEPARRSRLTLRHRQIQAKVRQKFNGQTVAPFLASREER